MSDTLNLANSIWPNGMKVDSDGHAVFYPLGTNKVEVPTSSTQWPKGNRFVSPFVYQDDKLVGFVDTKALTVSKNTAIYLPYTHIEAEFSAINKGQLQIHAPKAITKKASWKNSGVEGIPEAQYKYKGYDDCMYDFLYYDYLADISNGSWSEPLFDLKKGGNMFYECTALLAFESDMPSLQSGYYMFAACASLTSFASNMGSLENGYNMFAGCVNLTSFDCDDLSSLTNGNWMFNYCENLSEFDTDLPNLTNAEYMFAWCDNLTSFSSDLSSLTDGGKMFICCSNLISFSSDLSSLTNCDGMFYECRNLTTFSSDLSSLTKGTSMFNSCANLTSFKSDLSSLTSGGYMFAGCKLDTASVKHIADTINTYNGIIHIGIGNTTPNEQEEAAFNKIASKGWSVYVNGYSNSNIWNPTALTPENGEETGTPIPFWAIPFWAKPVQSDEEHAKYVDSEGNFYNILGGNYIYGDDLSTYGMFTCEEDAAANMRLTPYIKPQTEIENQ